MTSKLKLAILADCRQQLDLAGHHVVDGRDVDARDAVEGTIAALQTFAGVCKLPAACQDAQDGSDSTLWG